MKRIMFKVGKLACIWIALLAFVDTSLAQGPVSQSDRVYQTIKNLEGRFPIPTPYAAVRVGAFDASTGNFTWDGKIIRTTEIEPPSHEGPRPKPIRTTIYTALIGAVNVGLIFEVRNRQGDFEVVANGIRVSALPNQNLITVNVGKADHVNWTVRSGSKSLRNNLFLEYKTLGVFEIPALAVAIVYEPPQGNLKQNMATYTTTKSMGTTIRTSFSQENSTTRPAPSEFDNLMDFKNNLGLLASGLEQAGRAFPYAQAIAGALKAIASGLGEVNATRTEGTKVTEDHMLGLSNTQESTYRTGSHQGPGDGDRIVFLTNVKLFWFADGGIPSLGYLGHEGIGTPTVRFLRTNGYPGLDRDTIQALLNLDPFAMGGPQAPLSEPRFVYVDTYGLPGDVGPHDTYKFIYKIEKSDLYATTDFTVKTVDFRPGWLSFLGLGVTENKTVKTTVTHGRSREVKVGDKVEVDLDIYTELQPSQSYGIAAYYDRVFGTYAFKQVPLGTEAVSGTLSDASGRPLARQLVSLMVGDKKFSTRTDAKGHYSFRASTIMQLAGSATIEAGPVRKEFRFQGAPVRVDLRQ